MFSNEICVWKMNMASMSFPCTNSMVYFVDHRKRREVLDDSFYELLGGDTFIVPDRKISEPLDKILEVRLKPLSH